MVEKCIECGRAMTEQERRKAEAYSNRNGEILACIDCWREALAAGGWPGDMNDERRDDEDAGDDDGACADAG